MIEPEKKIYIYYIIIYIYIATFFLKTPINPINGMIGIPSEPGLGMEIDSSKIESEMVIK